MSIFHTPMSITCTASEDSRVRKEGYLFKESKWRKKTNKRWCVLTNGALYTFKSKLSSRMEARWLNDYFDHRKATESFNLITDYKYVRMISDKKIALSRSVNQKEARIFTAHCYREMVDWYQCIKMVQHKDCDDSSPRTTQLSPCINHLSMGNVSPLESQLFVLNDYSNKEITDKHAFIDEESENGAVWKCMDCYYHNRDIMVDGEWIFDEQECRLCGINREKKGQITNEICDAVESIDSTKECVDILSTDQLKQWEDVKKEKLYDTIKCDWNNSINKVYFEECNVEDIVKFIEISVADLNDNKLNGIKSDITSCCYDKKINGKCLLQIGRKGFVRAINQYLEYSSLSARIGRLYSKIKKYDINCGALRRICFILNHFEAMTGNISSSEDKYPYKMEEFISRLYHDPNEFLDDMDHALSHKQILNIKPCIECKDDECTHFQRISNQTNDRTLKQRQKLFNCTDWNDIAYVGYLDCIHIIIRHNKTSSVMLEYARTIKKYAEYSVYNTGAFIQYQKLAPKYRNLMEELTKNKRFYISREDFNKALIESKSMIDSGMFMDLKWRSNETNEEYGIEIGDEIPIECVVSIKLYCQHFRLRKALRDSYRSIDYDDNKIDSNFYWMSRYLYIATRFYGAELKVNEYLYHGLENKYVFDKFAAIFNTPTSTTTELDIAQKFTGDGGIVLKLSMKFKNRVNLSRCLDTTAISNHDEQERLFYGMEVLAITDIIEYVHENGGKWISYRDYMSVLLYFERIIEQKRHQRYVYGKVSKKLQKTHLMPLIQHQINRNNGNISKDDDNKIPQYILALFEHFCDSKRDGINLSCIMHEESMMHSSLRSILFKNVDDQYQINNRSIRLLFPNLKQYKNDKGKWIALNENHDIEDECSSPNHSLNTGLISEITQIVDIHHSASFITPKITNNVMIPTENGRISEIHAYIQSDSPTTDDSTLPPPTPPPTVPDTDDLPPTPPPQLDTIDSALNVNAAPFIPLMPSLSTPHQSVKTVCTLETIEEYDDEKELMSPKSNIKTICHGKPQYDPCKEHRAKGRITISRKFSDKKIPNLIKEKPCNLYDFMDKSLAVNGCIKYFNQSEVGVIDYGFHDKKTDGILYCVINQNKNKKRNYLYKMMNELYTAKQLEDRYKIKRDELPKSLQLQSQYMEQMGLKQEIEDTLKKQEMTKKMIQKTKWQKVKVFKEINNKKRRTESVVKTVFIDDFIKYFEENVNNINLIPILMFDEQNANWIEYLWIVHIAKDIDIGISLKYDEKLPNKIRINGIHLNKKLIALQHQLIPWEHDCHCLDDFNSVINDYHIGNPDDDKNRIKDLEKKNKNLKKSQNDHENKVESLESEIAELKKLLALQTPSNPHLHQIQ